MKKIFLASLLAMFSIGNMGDSIEASTTIYTGMPEENDTYYQPFKKDLNQFNLDLQNNAADDVRFLVLDKHSANFSTVDFNYPDIWVRDVAPVVTTKLVKFRYAPSYLSKRDSAYLNKRFTKFLQRRYRYQKSDLVLDGGNVQWNGNEIVVLTKKVFDDNPDWTKQEIVDELKYQLSVKKVIFISKEPGDVLGHSDGMVKFISSKKMFINDFSYEPGFLQKVKHQILQQEPDMQFIVLPSSYTSKGQYDKKIASAKGLYINMLETSQVIYFPIYGMKDDQRVLRIVQKNTDKKVIPINVSKLSTLGGSIHCLTWDVPNKFAK